MDFFNRINPCLILLAWLLACPFAQADRPRLAVLTDIGGDPDDTQSMVRLLVYANQFEIEAIVTSASGTRGELKQSITQPHLIVELIDAYEKVLPHLKQHEDGWPSAGKLRSVVYSGNPHRERDYIGAKHDTAGSRHLMEVIDRGSADRPLNISIWGGQTDLAQALWRVKHDRGEEGLANFVKRFRVYDIADQDGIADWMRMEFPGMYYILNNAPAGTDKRQGTFRGMYLTGDQLLTSRDWIETNIRSTGPLGSLYPTKTWTAPNPHGCLKEGDTPAWFFFLPGGGNDPADPTQPGWGGQFVRQTDGWYRDMRITESFDPRTTVSKWRPKFQAEFAKRMQWCLPSSDDSALGRR